MKATGRIYCLAAIAFVVCGCGRENRSVWEQLKQLGDEKTSLAIENKQLRQENKQLSRQVQTLSAIDPNMRLAELETLDKIIIGKRTGIYDKDGDGKTESLVIYLEPVDKAQDRVKAIGGLGVQLWDLNVPQAGKPLLAEWTLTPEQLQRHWSSTLFTNFYHIRLPLPDGLLAANKGELTVKVEFVDYLGGKTCRDQRLIRR